MTHEPTSTDAARQDRTTYERTGTVSHDEARDILSRYNASHFQLQDQPKARYSIPANPKWDDDLRLSAYIERCRRIEASLPGLIQWVLKNSPNAMPPEFDAVVEAVCWPGQTPPKW